MNKPQQFNFVSFGNLGSSSSVDGGDEFAEINRKKYTQEELDKAVKQSHDKGHQEGLTAGVEKGKGDNFQLDKQISVSLNGILHKVSEHVAKIDETAKTKSIETTKLSSLIAKKIAGDALKEDPSAKIESIVSQTINLIHEKVPATLFVNPSMTGKMEERVKKVISENKHSGTLAIKEDKNLPESGCRLEWGNGGVEYNPDNMWKEINKILGVPDLNASSSPTSTAEKAEAPKESAAAQPVSSATQAATNEGEKA